MGLTVDSESISKFNVTGSTYDQKGGSATTMASIICSLCNDSLLFANDAEEIKDGEEVLRDGSPTEAALRVLAEKIGFFEGITTSGNLDDEDTVSPLSDMYNEQFPRICKLEFNHRRKSMSVLCSNDSNNTMFSEETTTSTKKTKKSSKKS